MYSYSESKMAFWANPRNRSREFFIRTAGMAGMAIVGIFVMGRRARELSLLTNLCIGAAILMLPVIWYQSYQTYTRIQEIYRDQSERNAVADEMMVAAFRGAIGQLVVAIFLATLLFMGMFWAHYS